MKSIQREADAQQFFFLKPSSNGNKHISHREWALSVQFQIMMLSTPQLCWDSGWVGHIGWEAQQGLCRGKQGFEGFKQQG